MVVAVLVVVFILQLEACTNDGMLVVFMMRYSICTHACDPHIRIPACHPHIRIPAFTQMTLTSRTPQRQIRFAPPPP